MEPREADGPHWFWGPWAWLLKFQVSPTQPTAKLSPALGLVRLSRILVFVYMLGYTIPVGEVSECVHGVNQFVSSVEFRRPDQLDTVDGFATRDGGSTFTLSRVATLDDAVLFSRALVAALLPKHAYRGERSEEEQHYVLRVHRLVNSLVVRQRRVHETQCAYRTEPAFAGLYPKCYEAWPAQEEKSERVDGMEWSNTARGYISHLPLDRSEALSKVNALVRDKVWDRATREMSVGFAFHNAPGHFTGFCQVSFKISPYGKVTHSVDTEFLRLHPYAPEVNGGHLALGQSLFALVSLVVCIEVVYIARTQPSTRWSLAYLLRPWAIFDFLHGTLILWCAWLWYDYIMSPERTNYDPMALGFQDVAVLAEAFMDLMLCTSFALFLSVLRTVEYLVVVDPELAKIYKVLSKAVYDLGIFFIIFGTLFGGFVVSGYFLFGQSVVIFSDGHNAAYNLLLWFLALGGGMRALFAEPGGGFYLVLFLMTCVVVLFNMFTAIILSALDGKDEDGEKPVDAAFNHRLADWIGDRLGWPEHAEDARMRASLLDSKGAPAEV